MTVRDALHQLKLEISENENRKDFSFSEKIKWAEELKKEYSKIAEQRIINPMQDFAEGETGNTRDKVAKDLDIGSGETYRKAEYIYKNASEDLIKQLDEGQLSINKAYITLKEEKNQLEQTNKALEQSYNELSQKYTKENMILEDLICTNIMQRGVGNVNPMKMAKCIIELERIYGIKVGNNQASLLNNSTSKTQTDIAKELEVNRSTYLNYKKLTTLIPELQELIETNQLKATVGYKIWAKMSQGEQEKFFTTQILVFKS